MATTSNGKRDLRHLPEVLVENNSVRPNTIALVNHVHLAQAKVVLWVHVFAGVAVGQYTSELLPLLINVVLLLLGRLMEVVNVAISVHVLINQSISLKGVITQRPTLSISLGVCSAHLVMDVSNVQQVLDLAEGMV
jgi:hypothetical protein